MAEAGKGGHARKLKARSPCAIAQRMISDLRDAIGAMSKRLDAMASEAGEGEDKDKDKGEGGRADAKGDGGHGEFVTDDKVLGEDGKPIPIVEDPTTGELVDPKSRRPRTRRTRSGAPMRSSRSMVSTRP